MRIQFWGVRGSIACPGPDTVVYGGNTACLELRFGEMGRLVIIDAGSGIRPLGNQLTRNDLKNGPIQADIFLTHTHWDHIMGFPFFSPIYIPGTELNIYGPVTFEDEPLEEIVGGQLRYRYFPVMYSELSARIHYRHLVETRLDLGDGITVMTKFLNHTLLCLGYRFEYQGKVVCTAFDTEPFRNFFTDAEALGLSDPVLVERGAAAAGAETQKLINFYENADVLIHDAQYTKKEYESAKKGWGHSPMENAVEVALAARVKRLILFHHDPLRSDRELAALEKQYRASLGGKGLEVDMAREGMEIIL
ncbi:MAG: MBL fold metallo-hydrolase [Thermodesulfobacteriota bacterium]